MPGARHRGASRSATSPRRCADRLLGTTASDPVDRDRGAVDRSRDTPRAARSRGLRSGRRSDPKPSPLLRAPRRLAGSLRHADPARPRRWRRTRAAVARQHARAARRATGAGIRPTAFAGWSRRWRSSTRTPNRLRLREEIRDSLRSAEAGRSAELALRTLRSIVPKGVDLDRLDVAIEAAASARGGARARLRAWVRQKPPGSLVARSHRLLGRWRRSIGSSR